MVTSDSKAERIKALYQLLEDNNRDRLFYGKVPVVEIAILAEIEKVRACPVDTWPS